VEVDQLDAEVRALLGLPSRGEEPEPTLSRGRLGQPQGGPGRRVTTDDIQATLQAAAASIDPKKRSWHSSKKRFGRSNSAWPTHLLAGRSKGLLRLAMEPDVPPTAEEQNFMKVLISLRPTVRP